MIFKQGGQCNQHPISYLGVAAPGFPSFLLSHVIVHHIIPWSIKSTLQAFTVQLLEENLGSTYANISVAPAPRDILWQNMKSPAYLWSYILFFATILVAISCIALSPVIFAKNIQETIFNILNVDVHLFKGSCRILAMLLNSILFFTFTLLTPYFVKVAMKRTYKLFLPVDDRQIWSMEQGEGCLPVHHHQLHLAPQHHHPLPFLPGCLLGKQQNNYFEILSPEQQPHPDL